MIKVILQILLFLFNGIIVMVGFIGAITSITFLAETNNPLYGLGIIGGVLIASIGMLLENKRQLPNEN